jgi:hypothetical protein
MRLTELFQGCVAAKPRACTLDISTKNVQFQEETLGFGEKTVVRRKEGCASYAALSLFSPYFIDIYFYQYSAKLINGEMC